MPNYKLVNGIEVELTAEEEADHAARLAEHEATAGDAAILAQLDALEALQTPRLVCEAILNTDCTVSKPGCCIDGMTPLAALAEIAAQKAALRAQLTGSVYYQVEGG